MFYISQRYLPFSKKSLALPFVIEFIPHMIKLIRVNLRVPIFLFTVFLTGFSYSQSLSPAGIRNIKVEELSSAEIAKIKAEMQKENMSLQQLEDLALANGMTPANIAILKSRLENFSPEMAETNVEKGTQLVEKPIEVDKRSGVPQERFHKMIFGSDIFGNSGVNFDPNTNLAPPPSYVLGYGDELQVVVFGFQEFASTVSVNREGNIRLNNIGQLHVGGLSFQAASSMIKNACAKIYRTIPSGQSDVSITISKTRTINITLIGSRKPGNFNVSSLSTLFSALHVGGGPDDNGSYRNIELIRNNKVIKTIDLYKYLLKGDQSSNINLMDNDLIRIPIYTNRVKVDGKVKRGGFFELLENETFEDLLGFCGGFDEAAYKSNIKLIQNTDKELKITDLTAEEYPKYKPKNGDVFRISIILDRFENRIAVKGAVFRPDEYELTEGLTVLDLIKKADGLKEDAYMGAAQLYRQKEDLTKEIIGIDLGKALNNDPNHNLRLRKEDELIVQSVFDLRENYTVRIMGEVRNAGLFSYIENLTLYDLIIQAGGFNEAASSRIEIARVIKKDSIDESSTESSTLIGINLNDGINDPSQNVKLMPFDIVQIRRMPVYERNPGVSISGAVYYPGNYVLADKKEKILDVLTRAGGPSLDANTEGIKVLRRIDRVATDRVEKILISIPINYKIIKRKPDSKKNITLQPGDEIVVNKINETVKVFGAVQLNSEIPYQRGKRMRYYISSVGGFNENANKKKSYVVYANGIAKSTRNFGLFKVYPKIALGSEIVVPIQTPERRDKISPVEVASIAGVIGSLAGMTVAIINLLSK